MEKKFCVYTAITGGYEKLNESLPTNSMSVDFICLTDDPNLKSQTWEVRHIPGIFPSDRMRNQRTLKINPHIYLPEYESSLYIDNTVSLIADPWVIYKKIFHDKDILLFNHSYRSTVFEEFIAVAEAGLDSTDRIHQQLNHYKNSDYAEALTERPYWGGFIYRRHNHDALQMFATLWSSHVYRYARRDQLSLNYALKILNIRPTIISGAIENSWMHRWPNPNNIRKKPLKKHFFTKIYNKIFACYIKYAYSDQSINPLK